MNNKPANKKNRIFQITKKLRHILNRLLPHAVTRRLANTANFLADKINQICLRTSPGRKLLPFYSSGYTKVLKIISEENRNIRITFNEFLILEHLLLEKNLASLKKEAESLSRRPLISVVVPVYNTPPRLLRHCITSVLRQIYTNWELCLVDDGSTSRPTKRALRKTELLDSRIRIKYREENGGISLATNDGINMAEGEYIALLDHDDELSEDALLHVARRINEVPETDVIFTDQDKISKYGFRFKPFFKPGWSPALMRSIMYVGHLLILRTSFVRRTGVCNPAFDGVQDFELALRLTEKTDRIEHIPEICYHWRAAAGSIASSFSAKQNIQALQQRAVQEHLDRLNIPAAAASIGQRHRIRLIPEDKKEKDLISIIICSRDAGEMVSRCLDSIYVLTEYRNFEVILGDNGTTDPVALAAFERHPIRRIVMPGKFHFAAFNNRLAREAKGEYLLFLNNDTEILQEDWLARLKIHASIQTNGAVGALLTYPDNTVQHAGVVLGPRGTADHLFRNFNAESDFYHNIIQSDRDVTAVTAACLMISSEKFRQAGGFDEKFRNHYEDLDLCLRLFKAGYSNVYAGTVKLVHHESKTRGKYYDYTDRILLLDRWESLIQAGDPFSNENFLPDRCDFALGAGRLLK